MPTRSPCDWGGSCLLPKLANGERGVKRYLQCRVTPRLLAELSLHHNLPGHAAAGVAAAGNCATAPPGTHPTSPPGSEARSSRALREDAQAVGRRHAGVAAARPLPPWCTELCMHACMHDKIVTGQIQSRTHACNTCMQTCIHVDTCMHTCTHACMHAQVRTRAHTMIHRYTYTYLVPR